MRDFRDAKHVFTKVAVKIAFKASEDLVRLRADESADRYFETRWRKKLLEAVIIHQGREVMRILSL